MACPSLSGLLGYEWIQMTQLNKKCKIPDYPTHEIPHLEVGASGHHGFRTDVSPRENYHVSKDEAHSCERLDL